MEELANDLRAFAEERDWVQGDAAHPRRKELEDELADITIYLVRLADVLGIDLMRSRRRK